MEDNKNIVVTVSGNKVSRKDCIKIGGANGAFYEKNVDCFMINEKWYRKGNPRIYFNVVENEWRMITDNTIQGIVAFYEDNGSYTMGQFESDFGNSYRIRTSNGTYNVASKSLFDKIPKVWDKQNGIFYDYQYAVSSGFNPFDSQRGNAYVYQFDRMYSSESLIPLFAKIDNKNYCQPLLQSINRKEKTYSLVNKYSFGLELETSGGIIPESRCKELGLIPLRDGSIRGHEYTTIPMKGEDGLNQLMNQLEELKARCSFDRDCSVHVHFGNFKVEEKNILRLYNACFAIQNEIGEMFPKYIYNTSKYKRGGKDYCRKLPTTFSNISELYYYLSENRANWSGSFTDNHPQDPNRDRKWENHQRYFWVNFINLMFGERTKTVEFRIHTPTFNYSKLINWMFICMAIMNYAEMNEGRVDYKNLTIADIINFSYDKATAALLNDYVAQRKAFFKKSLNNFGDTYGVLDLIEDGKVEYQTPYHIGHTA